MIGDLGFTLPTGTTASNAMAVAARVRATSPQPWQPVGVCARCCLPDAPDSAPNDHGVRDQCGARPRCRRRSAGECVGGTLWCGVGGRRCRRGIGWLVAVTRWLAFAPQAKPTQRRPPSRRAALWRGDRGGGGRGCGQCSGAHPLKGCGGRRAGRRAAAPQHLRAGPRHGHAAGTADPPRTFEAGANTSPGLFLAARAIW
jgi:hypothetical protein